MSIKKRGLFMNFEGIDGAGKSSHIEFVASKLQESGLTVVTTREPGGTPLGEKVRDLLLHEKMNLETEALLMFASRRELIAQVIEPALKRGDFVISDRFSDSSFAFQCGGRGLPYEKLEALQSWVHPGLQPDITLLFDVPTQVAQARIASGRVLDKFEREQIEFHDQVRTAYLKRAEQYPERFRVVNSTKSVIEIREELVGIIDDFLMDKSICEATTKSRTRRP